MEDFFKDLVDTLTHYGLVVATVVSAVVMAIFRTAQRNGRVDLIESVICGIFAWGHTILFPVPVEETYRVDIIGPIMSWSEL